MFKKILIACLPVLFLGLVYVIKYFNLLADPLGHFLITLMTPVYFVLCVVTLVMASRFIFESNLKKSFRTSLFFGLLAVMIPYSILPLMGFIALSSNFPFQSMQKSPDGKWTVMISGTLDHLYEIRIEPQNADSKIPAFQVKTGASVFHKSRGQWLNDQTFSWSSADIGTITFKLGPDGWEATPKSLLHSSPGRIADEQPQNPHESVEEIKSGKK